MTPSHPTLNTGHFSPALLALKRFIKGTLRQAAIGAMSLMIVLNLSTHAPGLAAGIASESSSFASIYSATQENLSQPVQRWAQGDASDNVSDDASLEQSNRRPSAQTHSAISSRPRHSVIARMTHHHLTSARLSIPTASERAGVSVAGSQ